MSAKSRTKVQTDSSIAVSENTTAVTTTQAKLSGNSSNKKKSDKSKKKAVEISDLSGIIGDSENSKQPKPKQAKKSSPNNMAVNTDKAIDSTPAKSQKIQADGNVALTSAPSKTEKFVKAQTENKSVDETKDSAELKPACKTPQVMKLVQESLDLNPVLLAGKSRIPLRLRGKESLTRMMRRDMGEELAYSDDSIVVNITELAIAQETPIILDRFNACSCDKCIEVFSRIIAAKVPPRFARIGRNGRSPDNRDLSERVAPMRRIVLSEMTKELICSKKRWFHDDD